ncbi:hypothetical protein IP70_17275 [alpha proteobacterium AAP38]|nr:hypothetical protein IP70_17275 [alpha proteobacterium AAP38]
MAGPGFLNTVRGLLLAALVASVPVTAIAADLRLGVMNLAQSTDPHVGANRNEYMLHDQVYEGLAQADARFQPSPRLAESWEMQSDGSWLFRLRRDVRFQNGRPLTPRDVIYSFCRTGKVGPEPRPFAARLAEVASVTAPDAHSILVRHRSKVTIFPSDVANIPIIPAPGEPSSRAPVSYSAEGCAAFTDWLDDGKFGSAGSRAGTGPFRLVSFGDKEILLERNPDYWGRSADWDHVRLIRLAENERVPAMLEGRIDVLDGVSLEALPFFASQQAMQVVEGPSAAVTYLQSNQHVPGDGSANRFRDVRVRRALMLAIPARLLADRIVPGYGTATGQMAMQGMAGYTPGIPDDVYDPQEAKRLLAEAGLAGGFDTTLMVTPLQSKIGDAIAYFLDKVGVRVKVQVEPMERYIERLRTGDFQLFYGGWIFNPANMPDSLRALLGTSSGGPSRGAHNYAGYCNADIDRLLRAALGEPDPTKRDSMLQSATRAFFDDVAWIPVMHAQGRWVVRKGVKLDPRLDRLLLASEIRLETATR